VDFINRLKTWATPDMILGGDWNCVPDATLDVQSSNPLRYKNVGGLILENTLTKLGLFDFRRAQLEQGKEPTRTPLGAIHTRDGPDVVSTRLDRFYIPTNEAHEDLLPSLDVRWDIIWTKEARDHAAIVLTLEDAVGDAGHERHTIREDITLEPGVRDTLEELANEAYTKGGKEWQKWERAHASMRDFLLKETARRRVKAKKEIANLRFKLKFLQRVAQKKGYSQAMVNSRKEYTAQIYELEHPETKGEASLKSQVASAQLSDASTKRFFANYKAAAKQQWINQVRTAEWKDGEEPVFTGRTTTPKQVPKALASYFVLANGLWGKGSHRRRSPKPTKRET
jgi:hypothetical protein